LPAGPALSPLHRLIEPRTRQQDNRDFLPLSTRPPTVPCADLTLDEHSGDGLSGNSLRFLTFVPASLARHGPVKI
jgi:hypothetical protein